MEVYYVPVALLGSLPATFSLVLAIFFVQRLVPALRRHMQVNSPEILCPSLEEIRGFHREVPVLLCTSEETCTICLEQLSPGETCRQLPCKHGFHPDCLYTWWERCLQSNQRKSTERKAGVTFRCPTCRQKPQCLSPPV